MNDKRIEGNIMKRNRPHACASRDHLLPRTKKHKDVGNSDSGDDIVLSSPYLTRLSIKDVEEISNRRMKKLLLKQIRKVNVFSRTERKRIARLKQKHSLDCQGYQKSGVNHEEFRNLDDILKRKIKEHNDLMDMKWKELHDRHLASIKKVKQWEDRSITFLMKKDIKKPISLSTPTHPLISELGSEMNLMVGESVHTPPKAIQRSEILLFKEDDKGMIDGSSQNVNSDNAPIETEVLVTESDGEDDAASMPKVAPPNEPENGASYSASSHCERQLTSNREIEGNSSRNMDSCVKSLRGIVGDHPSELNSRCLESDGENDANTEPLYDVSDDGASEKDELLSKQKDEETLVNIPAAEDGNSNVEGSIGAPSREGFASPILPTRSCVLEKIGACSTLEKRDVTSPNMPDNEVRNVDYTEEAHVETSNREAEGRDATNSNTTFPQLNVENIPELPLSILASGSCGVVQVRTSTISENLSPSDLTATGLAIPNCEIPGTSSFRLPNQSSEPLANLGPREWPMVQPSIMCPPVPSVLGQDRTYVSSCTTVLRPANNYFLGDSSSTPSTHLLVGSDSLLNELVRVEKEKEDVSKNYETEMKSLRIAMEKEIEEIRKKYNLLLQDTENAFQMKKQDLESFKEKVYSQKLLAETLQVYHTQKPSKEDLPNALQQLSILLYHTSEQSTSPNAQRLVQPLEVHQLSDLITVDQGSTRPFLGIQNQQFLAPPQPQGSRPFLGIQNQQFLAPPRPPGSRPVLSMQNQQIHAPPRPQGSLPGLYQRGNAPGQRTVHPDGSQDNPVQLS